jgi:nicotinamidase-related amidase
LSNEDGMGEEKARHSALLIIDMINDFTFEGGDRLIEAARPAAKAIRSLRDQCDRVEMPVIYVNDNYGEWHSDHRRLIEDCIAKNECSAEIIDMIRPRESDYFIVKPQMSGFYATNLPAILPRLGVSRLILTGVAADICVLFTAADAHMREYPLWVPKDAVASSTDRHRDWALEIMSKSMRAELAATGEMAIEDWVGQ